VTASELAKLHGMLGDSHALNEFRRLEQERSMWMNAMAESNSLAEQIKKLVVQDSAAVQMAKQMYDAQKAQEESIRKMLDPLTHIRNSLIGDSTLQRMIDEFSKPVIATDNFTKLKDQLAGHSTYMQSLHWGVDSSMEHARKLLAEASVSTGLQQVMKSFEATNKHWTVPTALLESMNPLKAWQEQVGKLSLPVMDWTSAAALAKVLGREGIESQLAAWGINPDGSVNPQFVDQEESGLGFSRKSMELMALLSFILALLVPIYQEYSSAQSQTATDKKLEAQADALEGQRKMIEALAKLVEKALVQEAKRQEERFVVRERVAVVRSKPENGSTMVGKLLPNEVVRTVSEDGKWIEFEYYHWLHQEYRTGWALKKYFQRVARPESHGLSTSGQPGEQPPNPKSLTQLIGTAKGAFENAAEIDAFVRAERDEWER
jgi:hypothetical protein